MGMISLFTGFVLGTCLIVSLVYYISGTTHSKIPDSSKIPDTTKTPDNSKMPGSSIKADSDSDTPDISKIRDNSKLLPNSKIPDNSKISANSKLTDNSNGSAPQMVRNESKIHSYINRHISNSIMMNSSRPKRILFYNPLPFQFSRNIEYSASFFQNCEIRNCEMVYSRSLISDSDAVLLSSVVGLDIKKKHGQVWIIYQWESTQMHTRLATRNAPVYMKNKINWTVSYSTNADIYLPYGRLRQQAKEAVPQRNYVQIANNKSKDAVWVVSNCKTFSKREEYVQILKKYISVAILGKCGKKWNCGRRIYHDQCFDIFNTTYRYHLTFENSLCQEYITEKFYENYKYDILQVVRGNTPSKKPINISHEAYISANDFKNAHELGKFLKALSSDPQKYASMLRKKDEYTVVPYIELFRDAGCEICKRLHSVD